jgi:large subunit ribosomal protein L24
MKKKRIVLPASYHVKKGDSVKVLSGNHRGKTGEILEVLRSKARAVVRIKEKGPGGEELNMIKKAVRPTQDNPKGGIEAREGSIHVSNLQVIRETPAEKKPAKKAKSKE